VAGRDVWLVHPWSLGDPPADLAPGTLRLAVCDAGFHARWPWTARRWQFVTTRMRAIADVAWLDDGAAVAHALASARSVDGLRDPHLGPALAPLARREPAPAFEEPAARCASFSAWWARSRPIGIARPARP
jgi:deoxyribodipyrimidine photo-lyase